MDRVGSQVSAVETADQRPPFWVVCARAGDPLARSGRARSIWAANTAEATAELGIASLLIGSAQGMPLRIDAPDGLAACRRRLARRFGIGPSCQLFVTHGPVVAPSKVPDHHTDGGFEAQVELPRYVLPFARMVQTRDPRIVAECARRRVPYVYEDHDEDFQPRKGEGLRALVAPSCRALVAITAAVASRLLGAGIEPSRVIVLDSATSVRSLERYPARAMSWRRFLLDARRTHLAVYSGGLQEERGIDHLLLAAASRPDIRFVLVGGTSADAERIDALIAERGLDNVKLFGFVDHPVSIELQQAADVLILTRRDDDRTPITSPLKFPEYLASGSPIVAARIPALDRAEYDPLAVRWYQPERPETLLHALALALDELPRRSDGYAMNLAMARRLTWHMRQRRLLEHLGIPPAGRPAAETKPISTLRAA